jgi:hypothetical protein
MKISINMPSMPNLLIYSFLMCLTFIIYTKYKNNDYCLKENFCQIEYPVCDNFCQKTKLDLCTHLKKDGVIHPMCKNLK